MFAAVANGKIISHGYTRGFVECRAVDRMGEGFRVVPVAPPLFRMIRLCGKGNVKWIERDGVLVLKG